jgi:hypothetical protein
VAAIVVIASLVVLIPRDPGARTAEAIAEKYPVAALDVLAREHPAARVLADYGWGGFTIHRLHDMGGTVFVDGRNDMYPQEILDAYSTVRAADDGWEDVLEEYEVEAILMPPDAPIVRGFAQDAGWCEAYADDIQVLLLRDCS